MRKLKAVKASIILATLLFCCMGALITNASAAIRIITLDSVVEMISDSEDREGDVLPFGSQRLIDVAITYSITGLFAKPAAERLASEKAEIYLTVGPTPDWFTAHIEPNVIRPSFSIDGDTITATVVIDVNEKAPAKTSGEITVIANVREKLTPILYKVNSVEVQYTFTFIPGYLPVIGIIPDDTFKTISPGETATFNIGIENLGNGKTEVSFEIADVPKGWSANIPTKANVGTTVQGDENFISVPLTIQPPYSFGYHNERESISVKITPAYFAFPDSENYTGKTYIAIFTVESRGFSTPGFETLFVILSLVVVIFIVKKRMKKQ